MLLKLYFILLTTAVGMVMGPGGAQAAKDVESDEQTLHQQLLKGRFPHVTKSFYNDASHSYDIVPTLSGYQFQNSYNLPTRVRSKGVHLSATDGSLGPFVEQVRLTDLDSEVTRISDDLGYSVSVDGNTAVVGASGDENNRGSAYVFTYDGGAWIETAKLIPTDGEAYDLFGQSVSISDSTIVVGAPRDGDNGRLSGAVYVFAYDGGMWTETVKLIAADGEDHDLFGHSVSVSGRTIVIGALGDADNGGFSGSAYVFTYEGGMWTETAKLTAADGIANDYFGEAVSVDRGVVVIGAAGGDNRRGSAYVYRVSLVERADADGDGVIGMPDFRVFAEAYGTTDLRFDFNEDGTVGFSDFLIFISLYSESA